MPSKNGRFEGKRVLITQADKLMGPAIVERFEAEGAQLIRNIQDYTSDPQLPCRIVADAGHVDVLVINLRPPDAGIATPEAIEEAAWQSMFNHIVHPTIRFVTAVLPQIIERREGKIVVVSSAIPMRPIKGLSTYCAAR